MLYLLQQGALILRFRYWAWLRANLRIMWLSFLGMKVGKNTLLPKVYITWPHQVVIGCNCVLEHSIQFKYDGVWERGPSILIGNQVFIGCNCEFNIKNKISIGNDTLIASGCRFIDHDHGITLGQPMRIQQGSEKPIVIGNDVWLGCNVVVLKGVHIGDGAIIAAGAVVTKHILPNEIWAGVPARKISQRK